MPGRKHLPRRRQSFWDLSNIPVFSGLVEVYGAYMTEQERDPDVLKKKERANTRFAREEMGELLKLFSGLGITVAVGIVGFFLLGLWVDGRLQEWGWQTRGVPRVVSVVAGVGLSIYWAYLRIARHLERFAPSRDENNGEDEPL